VARENPTWRQTIASGRFSNDPADFEFDNYLIELKTTEKDSISVRLKWLTKNVGESLSCAKTAALLLRFCWGSGLARPNGGWMFMRWPSWCELTDTEAAETDEFWFGLRETDKASVSISLDELVHLRREATFQGKMPALAVAFLHDDGSPWQNGQWVAVEERTWTDLAIAE
jgi:hypothetical protein